MYVLEATTELWLQCSTHNVEISSLSDFCVPTGPTTQSYRVEQA